LNTNRLTYLYNFSVIIPHRNSISTLERAILSIPNNPDIQIIIVDNSFIPLKVEDISIDRSFEILYSNYNLGAGGARNLGVRNALGKWLLFLDSDDHFDSSAFNVFYSYLHSDNEVIFCSQAAFSSMNSNSDRGNEYLRLNLDFIDKKISENQLRYQNIEYYLMRFLLVMMFFSHCMLAFTPQKFIAIPQLFIGLMKYRILSLKTEVQSSLKVDLK
jgi:glycosyltransferase involved in cell wall biosynthesis